MRTARIKGEDGVGYYHCMSRVIERSHRFGTKHREVFRKMMRAMEEFCGVEVLTYAILSNHFHILLYVPERVEIDDDELVRRLRLLYEKQFCDEFAQRLKDARDLKNPEYANRLRQRYLVRMYDVSKFMQALKQRFTIWYNRNNDRKGTLWEERFKSLMVQGSEHALLMVAAYIDLNAVRAGIVRDPKEYRFCGYGEAVGGSKQARKGLAEVMVSLEDDRVWGQVSHKYRKMLYIRGEETETKPGFSSELVEKVVEEDGKLKVSEVLRCRVRYFSDGVVLGSKEFVDDVFRKHREEFGVKRKTGARKMRWSDWGDLCTMRDLRMRVIETGAA